MSPEHRTARPPHGRHGGARRAVRARRGDPGTGIGKRILKWGLLACVVGAALGVGAFAYGYAATDIPDPNEAFQAQTSFVYYADGKTELGSFATQNRVSIPLSEVPQHVQDAMVAAENRTFWTDKGIDPKGIVRAAFSNATGNSTQGASTITQQYVKLLYLSQERTITRKVREAFLSLKIQQQMSKSQILQGYLNTIYFGRGAYGIQAAAQAYFDKDASELSVREGAVLAAVLNSPGNYDPALGKDAAAALFERYQYVLGGMADMHTLPRGLADRAAARLPRFPHIKTRDTYGGQRGHVLMLVKAQLRDEGFSDAEIEGGGLRITTTFTRKAMRAARQGVIAERPKGLKNLHVAVASVDPRTGALRGMFAGQDYLNSQYNWAGVGGQPGSAFKPFALAAGIKDGFSLKSTFQGNSPYRFPDGHKVVNEGPGDGNDYGRRISLIRATEESVNTAYMDLTASMEHGPDKILRTAVDMGVPRDASGLAPISGIALGSAIVSPIDMANSYATIADRGQAKDWYAVTRVQRRGKTEYQAKPHKDQHEALPGDIDADVSYALQQVVKHGTGQNAMALGRPAAGKTGTATNNDGDVSSSWFVGYTPQLSTAVMYVRGDGNDPLNNYLPSYFGAVYPTQTWTAVMQRALAGAPIKDFPPPAWVSKTLPGHNPLPTYTPTPTPSPTPSLTPRPKRLHLPHPRPTLTCSHWPCDGNGNGRGKGHGKGHWWDWRQGDSTPLPDQQ